MAREDAQLNIRIPHYLKELLEKHSVSNSESVRRIVVRAIEDLLVSEGALPDTGRSIPKLIKAPQFPVTHFNIGANVHELAKRAEFTRCRNMMRNGQFSTADVWSGDLRHLLTLAEVTINNNRDKR